MAPADYDLAGFTVGVVDRPKMLDPANVRPGDVILGLPSTGVHSNGYSLVRKVIGVDGIKPGTPEAAAKAEELSRPLEELGGASLADALLAPTRIYVKPILELLRGGANVHAIAHITGGGITENLNRALADDVDAVVTRNGAEMGWTFRPSSPTCRVRPSSRPTRHARPSTWRRSVPDRRPRGRGCRDRGSGSR